jgi:NAD+ kinase
MKARPRVAVVLKRSSYGTYVEDEHDERVLDLLATNDPTVRRMMRAHEDHEATGEEVLAALEALGAETHVFQGSWARIEGAFDLVVTVGGDGTLLAASHQVGDGTPIVGVNSAPDHSVGFFCAAKKGSAAQALEGALDGSLRRTQLTRMHVELNGRVLHRRVLNEALFCHASPAATSRYILRCTYGDGRVEEEEQKSSGLWIGPAAGSTAAQRSAGGKVLPLLSKKIQFVVREPYTAVGEELRLRVGVIDEDGVIEVRNKMRQAKIFLDGHHTVFDATIGDVLVLRRSSETLTVIGLTRNGDTTKASSRPSRPPRPAG